MARKVKDFVVESEGRDIGKVFRITEMPALRAEKWAIRALQALAREGVELPENYNDVPMARFAEWGLNALARAPWELVEPLMDEMMTCVELVPDPGQPKVTRAIMPDIDIEEPLTFAILRREVLSLHVGFF